MLRFGGTRRISAASTWSGNVGVRFVQTEASRAMATSASRPPHWYNDALASGQGACDAADNGTNQATDIQCWLTPALLAYSTGTGQANTLDKSYTNVLPSFNVRFGFTDKQFVRFGYSKGMSRPGLRPAAQLGGHQCAAHRHQQQLAVSRQECAGPGHRLQLRVQRRSRLRRPRAGRSRQLRPVVRACTSTRAVRSR